MSLLKLKPRLRPSLKGMIPSTFNFQQFLVKNCRWIEKTLPVIRLKYYLIKYIKMIGNEIINSYLRRFTCLFLLFDFVSGCRQHIHYSKLFPQMNQIACNKVLKKSICNNFYPCGYFFLAISLPSRVNCQQIHLSIEQLWVTVFTYRITNPAHKEATFQNESF